MSRDRLIQRQHISNVIGCLCVQPKLMKKDGINLEVRDFHIPVYKVIYSAIATIYNNSEDDIKQISKIDVVNEIKQYSEYINIYNNNGGEDFLFNAIETANVSLFDKSYDMVKKFSLLRDCYDAGFDIKDVYDYDTTDVVLQGKQMTTLVNCSIDDIVSIFNEKISKIKCTWSFSSEQQSYGVDEGLDDLLERLHSSPEFGHPFANGFYNAIFRGKRKSKFMIRSAGTGVGKTRLALADICTISCPELYDLARGEYVVNGNPSPSTFISTELEIEELQTCMLAYISGVSEEVIKKGKYDQETFIRIQRAIDILKRSPISLHYIDDFSIGDIELLIERDVINKGVEYVFFDYIQLVPKLALTMQKSYGMGLREDQILVNLSSKLKLLCNKYGIYLSTATQLNRGAKEHENRDSAAIRGSSAIIDKADHAVMCFRTTQRDIDQLKEAINTHNVVSKGFNNALRPNFCHYVYKNRSGMNGVIIWTKLDYTNMREEICFVTNMDYEYMYVEPLYIDYEG